MPIERICRCRVALLCTIISLSGAACTDFDADGGVPNSNAYVSGRQGSFSGARGAGSSSDGGDDAASPPFVGIDTWSPQTDPARTSDSSGSSGAVGVDGAAADSLQASDALNLDDSHGPGQDAGATDDVGVIDAGSTDTGSQDAGGAVSDSTQLDAPGSGAHDTTPVDPGSCIGRCGIYNAAGSCQCDKGCAAFDDCCADFVALCTADASAPQDAGDKPDTAEIDVTPDANDVAEAPDANDVAEAPDANDVAEAPDANDVAGAPDADDVAETPDTIEPVDTIPTPDATDATSSGDSAWYPDWQGYPDVSFADGTDIFGGVIKSCKNLYFLIFNESCTGNGLTASCIDTTATSGSVYAQFLFGPLKDCVNTNCTAKCTGDANTGECVQKCLGKHCAYPFFACLTEGEGGNNGCPTTLQCLEKPEYKDKIFSIATFCFGNAKHASQKQVADFFSCGQQPQTKSCFGEIAKCYDSPDASASCSATIACADACNKQNKGEPCVFECVGGGDADAIKLLDAVQDCQLQNCQDCAGPKGCGDSCGGTYCAAQWGACMADK